MRLYIVRHAVAVPRGQGKDEARALTGKGINKMEKAAAGLLRLEVAPSLVLSSPLVRARQTAEILIEALHVAAPLEITDTLSPSASRPALYRELLSRTELDSVLLVGHQPSLGQIAGEIIWGSAGCELEFKKGGACAIDLETMEPAPQGSLLWFLPPSILRGLAP